MTRQQEIQLFQSLAANQPRLREYLEAQKAKQVEVLCKAVDLVAVHRAQGGIAAYDTLLTLLAAAPALPA